MINRLNSSSAAASFVGYDRSTAVTRSGETDGAAATGGKNSKSQTGDSIQLSDEAQRQVQQLKKRDQEVRAHEQAHLSAGADLVQGGASFTFERGPDGKMYAVGGEVKIDTSPENEPDQTIRKMQQVKRAALAPGDPSSADRAVAARAGQIEAQARQEKNQSEKAETEVRHAQNHQAPHLTDTKSALPGRRPYSADLNGHVLNIQV